MPFWWRRRNKPWYSTWRKRRYRRRRFTYKKRRPYNRRRRRARKPRRRRRRKPYKVRRKKKAIVVKQWQPDRIRKCKIKGRGTLVMGAHGRQYICFTNVKERLTPSRSPAGGGFGVERFTLQYLYQQWKARNNIWTASNKFTDLARYLGAKFIFYRHPDTDFIVNYSRQPPFNIDKDTYMQMQPQQMLLGKHKRIILSKTTKPTGRIKHVIKIGPPKLLTNKWFFQEELAKQDLLQIAGTAASFKYPTIGCCNENRILNLYSLDTKFYQDAHWMQAYPPSQNYAPFATADNNLVFTYKTTSGTDTVSVPADKTKWLTLENGWFQPKILAAYKVTRQGHDQALLPMVLLRYNPATDDGTNNIVTIVDLVAGSWQGPYTEAYTIRGVPLWMALNGYANYVITKSGDKGILEHSIVCVYSDSLYRLPTASDQKIFPILGSKFVNGKPPYDQPMTDDLKNKWYPRYFHQQEPINDIVCCGPLVPKFYNQTNSTWELQYYYSFYFKWGGPEITDNEVDDPKTKGHYPTSADSRPIQISNPLKQTTKSLLHKWDFRRGILTKTAYKRMCDNLETDTDFQADAETPKKKKKVTCELRNPEEETQEIQDCLLSLCETNSSQEESNQNLQQLINKQKLKQQQLKQHLLTLLTDLKSKQNSLRLHIGNLQ
nr:MAG: ORF1 [Torque teno midi virus]